MTWTKNLGVKNADAPEFGSNIPNCQMLWVSQEAGSKKRTPSSARESSGMRKTKNVAAVNREWIFDRKRQVTLKIISAFTKRSAQQSHLPAMIPNQDTIFACETHARAERTATSIRFRKYSEIMKANHQESKKMRWSPTPTCRAHAWGYLPTPDNGDETRRGTFEHNKTKQHQNHIINKPTNLQNNKTTALSNLNNNKTTALTNLG